METLTQTETLLSSRASFNATKDFDASYQLHNAVSGRMRFKYSTYTAPHVLAPLPTVVHDAIPQRSYVEPELEPMVKDAACQSLYRESEAQTMPYTPAYVVPEGTDPEVLKLTSLTYGEGLPAGRREVELIEAARAKRAAERSLPPLTDEASLELRRLMIREQEQRDFDAREKEILAMNKEHGAAFDEKIRANAEELATSWDDRVEHRRQLSLTEKDQQIAVIQRRRIKGLRKLSAARERTMKVKEKRDIIAEYADYGSEVYAPLARNGLTLVQDKLMPMDVRPPQLESLQGIVELETQLPNREFEVTRRTLTRSVGKGHAARKTEKLNAELERADASLRMAKGKLPLEQEQREELLAVYRETVKIERPPTPEVEPKSESSDVEVATVTLQRLLRGRAIQNLMFAGRMRRQELIAELRAEGSDETIHEFAETSTNDARWQGVAADALVGSAVGRLLSGASKQLRRFADETQISRMVRVAEDTRRVREAEESGRRQKEATLRAEAAEEFRQMMAVHRESASSFVMEITADAAGRAATEMARADAAFSFEQEMSHDGNDNTNSDVGAAVGMLRKFVVPELMHRLGRMEADIDDRKFSIAAHSALDVAVRHVETVLGNGI